MEKAEYQKMQGWKTRHWKKHVEIVRVENAGEGVYGQPNGTFN